MATDDPRSLVTNARNASTRPFSPSSPWNTTIPEHVTYDPQSDVLTTELVRQINTHNQSRTINVNTTSYTPTLYVVDSHTPRVNVTPVNCSGHDGVYPPLVEAFRQIPIPHDANSAKGTDQEMSIWQPETDTMWDLWKASKDELGNWSACWGGRLTSAHASSGAFPHPFGTSASGLSLIAGLIRPEEIKRGEIPHALALGIPGVQKDTVSWPANRTDGRIDPPSGIVMGQRFQLDPSLDLDTLPLARPTRIIARAMQQYGVIVRETAGGVTLYAEDASSVQQRGSSTTYDDVFENLPNYEFLRGIPLDRLHALPHDYGKP